MFEGSQATAVRASYPPRAFGVYQPMSDADLSAAEVIRSYDDTGLTTLTAVRSTLLAASTQAVRECGYFDRYVAALPRQYHDQVLHTLAATWLPLDVAMAHYFALDALALPEEELISIGYSVGTRLQGAYLGTLARGVKQVRVNLWALSGKVGGLWSRVFEGGGVAINQIGPKDAQIAIRGLPLLESRHFRIGFRGVVRQCIEALAGRCFVREVPDSQATHGLDFLASWV